MQMHILYLGLLTCVLFFVSFDRVDGWRRVNALCYSRCNVMNCDRPAHRRWTNNTTRLWRSSHLLTLSWTNQKQYSPHPVNSLQKLSPVCCPIINLFPSRSTLVLFWLNSFRLLAELLKLELPTSFTVKCRKDDILVSNAQENRKNADKMQHYLPLFLVW